MIQSLRVLEKERKDNLKIARESKSTISLIFQNNNMKETQLICERVQRKYGPQVRVRSGYTENIKRALDSVQKLERGGRWGKERERTEPFGDDKTLEDDRCPRFLVTEDRRIKFIRVISCWWKD